MKAFVLLSGGVDSMACIHFYLKLGYEVEGIFCNYGQLAANCERLAVERVSKYYNIPLRIVEVKYNGVPQTGEICGRNALLVWLAFWSIGFGLYKIILGIHDGTGYTDCSPIFVDKTNRALDCYPNGTVLLEAPFLNWNKAGIARYCKNNRLPYYITYSCEEGTMPPCGKCLSCIDRKEFFDE